MTQETQELGTETGKTVTYDYDLASDLTDLTYPGGTDLDFDYDGVYNLTSIVDTDEPNDPVAEYQYNKAHELTRLDLRNGSWVDYAYDAMGRLESLANKRPGGATLSSYVFARNKVGCPTRLTYHDGRYRFYDYDDLYRLTREEHWTPQQAKLLWHDYDYDAAGNRDWKQHWDGSGPLLDYTYDAAGMNQLTDVEGDTGDRMDVSGTVNDDNLASVTVWNTTPDPDSEFAAQLRQKLFIARAVELEEGDNDLYAVALDKASNETRYPENETEYHTIALDSSVDLDYVYNDRGCLTEIHEGTTWLVEYVYDYENRLIKVVDDPDGTPVVLAEFTYDGLGRRIKSTVRRDGENVTTRFVYSGDDVVQEYEYDSGWVLAAEYVHGIGIDEPLRLERGGSTYYYHYDGYGSVSELTNEAGALSQGYEYDAWGTPTVYDATHASQNPYLYTGRRWDAEIGLYYYRTRHYAPHLGRFLQPDPAGYDDGPNLYAYVQNTPTAYIDPTGMTTSEKLGPTHQTTSFEHQKVRVDDERGRHWKWPQVKRKDIPDWLWDMYKRGLIKPPRYLPGNSPDIRPGDMVWDPFTWNEATRSWGVFRPYVPGEIWCEYELAKYMDKPWYERFYLETRGTVVGKIVLTIVDFTPIGDAVIVVTGYDVHGRKVSEFEYYTAVAGLAAVGITTAAKGASKAIDVAGDAKRASKRLSKLDDVSDLGRAARNLPDVLKGGRGFDSYGAFRRAMGSAGEGRAWHHIVEQSQIGRSRFPSKWVNNTRNCVSVPAEVNARLNKLYSSNKYAFTKGKTIRDWLTGRSFEFQHRFGKSMLDKAMRGAF